MIPDNVSSESVEWARTHIKRFGDTDIFPVPFEYEAIANYWQSIKVWAQGLDLAKHSLGADRRVFVIKPGGGFRAATQLDPLDQLIFAAMTFESASSVEQARVPKQQKVACAYRLKVTADGGLFSSDNGWDDFHSRSRELASNGKFLYVLTLDIADFYNRLGHHRVQNALEMAGLALDRTQNIERMLSQQTAKQSQGVPVGPTASIVFAEASLTDVDNFLMRKRRAHTRYVDDFRIFCSSRREAINVRREISEYLFSVHRLSFESSKSKIYPTSKFLSEELNDPKEQEEQAKLETLNELYEALASEHGKYFHENLGEDELESLDLEAERASFVDLFKLCIERRPLHLGLARHLLRKATKRRSYSLNELVFLNLETLAPVFRDVINYLAQTVPRSSATIRGSQLQRFALESDVADLPFIQLWLTELYCRRPDFVSAEAAMEYGASIDESLGCRPAANIALAYGQVDWIRGKKEIWRNYGAWDRRAIIRAAQLLPVGERRPFLSGVIEQGDLLDRTVAHWVLTL